MKERNLRLLVVEDSCDDENLIRRAVRRLDEDIEVESAYDGEEAIERLCGSGSTAPLPDLVLLDWKLPKVMGCEVLRAVRRSDRCKDLIVVAFSSSDGPDDRSDCEILGGSDYIVKPVGYEGFMAAVQGIVKDHCSVFLAHHATSTKIAHLAQIYTADSAAVS
jgi:CheY-like chemotaxis protein